MKYRKNKPAVKQAQQKFIDVYSRNNLLEIKDGVYIRNVDMYKSIGTHWIAFHVNDENVIYSDSFREIRNS